jgi:hypothetical protein
LWLGLAQLPAAHSSTYRPTQPTPSPPTRPNLRSSKSERSALILRDYLDLTPGNGKYTENQLQERQQFENAELSIKPGESWSKSLLSR